MNLKDQQMISGDHPSITCAYKDQSQLTKTLTIRIPFHIHTNASPSVSKFTAADRGTQS